MGTHQFARLFHTKFNAILAEEKFSGVTEILVGEFDHALRLGKAYEQDKFRIWMLTSFRPDEDFQLKLRITPSHTPMILGSSPKQLDYLMPCLI